MNLLRCCHSSKSKRTYDVAGLARAVSTIGDFTNTNSTLVKSISSTKYFNNRPRPQQRQIDGTMIQRKQEIQCASLGGTPSCRSFGSWPKIRPLRIRAITMDVTGTLVSFRGSLSQHYVKSAEKCGVMLPKSNMNFDFAFKVAYKEISQSYPCFGYNTMTGKDWWRHCVLRSFEIAGANMTDVQEDRVFQRIYSIFGSQAAYERFDDSLPFLQWANRNQIACGLLSNADERYGDSILPMLGLTHDEIQFHCFSKYYGYEKPDPRFFKAAIERAEDSLTEMEAEWSVLSAATNSADIPNSTMSLNDPLLPSQILHIGNDYTKDFEGARRAGMHAVLLDRYDEPELAAEWRRRGAIVLKDLMDVVEFLGRTNCQLGSNDKNESSSKDSN